VADDRRAVAAGRHRTGEQAGGAVGLLAAEPGGGEQSQVGAALGQVAGPRVGERGEVEAAVGVPPVEPAGPHRMQPGDDLAAGPHALPSLYGRQFREQVVQWTARHGRLHHDLAFVIERAEPQHPRHRDPGLAGPGQVPGLLAQRRPEPTVPVLTLILVCVGALALANLVAALPGRVAGRTPAAALLRAE
jgi:hypothetical protein